MGSGTPATGTVTQPAFPRPYPVGLAPSIEDVVVRLDELHRDRAIPAAVLGAEEDEHLGANLHDALVPGEVLACLRQPQGELCELRASVGHRQRLRWTGMSPDRDAILKALEQVIDPELKRPVTDLDMVRDVLVQAGASVDVTIALTVAGCPLRSSFEEQVAHHVGGVPGVTHVGSTST